VAELLILGLCLVVSLIAAVTDSRTRTIPNMLTYGAILAGLAVWIVVAGFAGLQISLLGIAVGFLPAFLLLATLDFGGGDVKLLTGLGAMAGYPTILDILLFTLLGAGIYALALIIWHGRVGEVVRGMAHMIYLLPVPGASPVVPAADIRMPFAVPIMLGTWWALLAPMVGLGATMSLWAM
jgi:prepilin peptidase CpaA